MKNKIKILAFAVLTSMLVNVTTTFAVDDLTVNAYGLDTIAGYEAQIYTSQTLANTEVTFTIEKPDHTKLAIPMQSDSDGMTEFSLYDYHTKTAGEYKVSARLENGSDSAYNSFYVYPDSVSTSKSTIEASKLVGAPNGNDKIYLTVTLTDNHENPIKGHTVNVISSRSDDVIQQISNQPYTNNEGSMIFAVSSAKEGVSVYSILDSTSGDVLDERLHIAFTGIGPVGGDLETAFAESGEVSYLAFENFPASIQSNSDVAFELAAYDDDGIIVPNYVGTVHFSVEGGNSVYASVPNDYTFDIDLDSGVHLFSGVNSLNFGQPGSYTVVATDLSNFTIRGETDVTVGTGSTGTDDPTTSFDLNITSPSTGTYSQNNIMIAGTAPSTDLKIEIYDNDVVLDTIDVDNDRTFAYEAMDLLEGSHSIYAIALDASDIIQFTSDEVGFEIDTTPPQIEDFYFEPTKNINPGDIIDITVVTDESVFQGAVVFNIDIAELEQDADDLSKYTTSIPAPSEIGTYPIDVILVDELGNEGSYTDVSIITIGEPAIVEPPDDDDSFEVTDLPPADVFGVRSQGSDGRVTLKWEPANDDNHVDHYKIYYGISPANLKVFVSTSDNKTSWYIPNLKNGNEYFFAISAIDDQGQESDNLSSIVSGTPFLPQTLADTNGTDLLGQDIVPDKQASTGPEMLWFVVLSLVISQLYFKFKNKVC